MKVITDKSFLKLMQAGILIPALTQNFSVKEKFINNPNVKYIIGSDFAKFLLEKIKSMLLMT